MRSLRSIKNWSSSWSFLILEISTLQRSPPDALTTIGSMHGWLKDSECGACDCWYLTVSWVCQEENEEKAGQAGIPVGLPESMAGVAFTSLGLSDKENGV